MLIFITVLLATIIVEIFILFYRIEQHLRLLRSGPTNHGQFKCYYCGGWFPVEEIEVVHGFSYCPGHGSKRKMVG